MVGINDKLRPYATELELVVELLREKYPPLDIKPGRTINELMFDGGRQDVLNHLYHLVEQFKEENKTNVLST